MKFLLTIGFIFSTLTCERVCAVEETASTVWQSAHSAVHSLGDDVHSFLVSLFGKQSVDTLLQIIQDGVNEISQAAAAALNAVATYVYEFLVAAELYEKLQKLLTLEGMIFVAKFAFLIIPGYWLLFKAVRLFAIVFRAVIKLAFFPLNCIFGVGKVFKKVTSMAKQLKGIKMKKKQK